MGSQYYNKIGDVYGTWMKMKVVKCAVRLTGTVRNTSARTGSPNGCQARRELSDPLGPAFSTTAVTAYTDTSSIINDLADPVKHNKANEPLSRDKRRGKRA